MVNYKTFSLNNRDNNSGLMNILFMYNGMFHPLRGGLERVSDLLCREFVRRGHCVFYLHHTYDEKMSGYSYPASMSFFPNSSVTELKENGAFYRNFLIQNKIDIVIVQNPMDYHKLCAFSKDLRHVKVVSVIHCNPLYMYHHMHLLMWRLRNDTFIEKIKRVARVIKMPKRKRTYLEWLRGCYDGAFANTDLVCLLSEKFIPELRSIRIKHFDINKTIAIGNPNTYPLQDISINRKKKQILYVGRIEWYQKRVDRMVVIWKKLYKQFPDWELVIVGDGSFKQELEQKAVGLERIAFVGWKDPESYYRDAAILCLTSDFEGWGMVLTEAMTFGTVPVAFNTYAAVTEIIENGCTGILVKPFSYSRFAGKLAMLMRDDALRTKMAASGKAYVRRFDIQRVADRWESVFRNLKDGSHC
ncbi:glycosyltransferase involved in cell wall biosynthesis [Bacteroides heparinolyticus]|uniref:Glycosyltransferase involved in cell wall biosynthesis n=2 Tax=Prevotella heparinolytica TaxID=28113 RepID=A0A4R2LN45_9BACE|nr:glycosyltransferase involved in cell wall biosynthesis [Bacteroides heparinolyticus]